MADQVDNGTVYLARYCGPFTSGSGRVRVEWRKKQTLIADTTWDDFKEIVRLGQELIKKVEAPDG